MQNRLTKRINLLDNTGNLNFKGYATEMLFNYNRNEIKAKASRIKEWDYYYVGNQHYGVALTIADNSYMGLMSASFLNFDTGYWKTSSVMLWFTKGKIGLPSTSVVGDVKFKNSKIDICFTNDGKTRRLTCNYPGFDKDKPLVADIILSEFPKESMVIATPFNKDKHFYFNQKINCMKAGGFVKIGKDTYSFDDNDSLGLLDWGRGVWTYKNTWYWGSLSTVLEDGKRFGFNIGYGFGDTSAASENMLFFDGKAHKLSQVTFNIPMENGVENYMKPWTFTSDDGRFEMSFNPIIDRKDKTDVGIIGSDQHQVFGKFSGKATLDDGEVVEIKDALGFAEKVFNKW